jgi:hypothetical protein
LLQYGAFEIALRHVKLNSLSIPKEDHAIVFPVALYKINCFWIEGVVSDGNKRHGKACSHQLRTELADNGGDSLSFLNQPYLEEIGCSISNARPFDTSLGWEALRPNTKLRYDCLHSAASLLFANQ